MSDDVELERHAVHPSGVTAESGRWSHASSITIGGAQLIFVAGQTARTTNGGPAPAGGFEAQFQVVYQNLDAVLAASGASLDAVVSMRTFLTRADDVPEFVRLRDALHDQRFKNGQFPPNTLVVVERLADPNMLIEIEAIAVTRG